MTLVSPQSSARHGASHSKGHEPHENGGRGSSERGNQPFLNVSTNEAPAESAADEISAPVSWSPWRVMQEFRA